MYRVLIFGAGKIGSTIACLLAHTGDFEVHIADKKLSGDDVTRLSQRLPHVQCVELDVTNHVQIGEFLKQNPKQVIIASLPYFLNTHAAEIARNFNLHYFDLTEDVIVSQKVRELSQAAETAFVGQCGLAPGFISIVANDIMQRFDNLETVKMRVGALPANISNELSYALTWSTEGLINEYGNICHGIENGHSVHLSPLEGLETIQIDGLQYEAFNTSGGLGTLAQTYAEKVRHLSYKTIRYPGHCAKMKFLMHDLRLNEDRSTLQTILERAIPKTYQDVVLIYVSVSGRRGGIYMEENYVNKIYPRHIAGLEWSAIQITTAASVCAVVDIVLTKPQRYHGMVLQEQFDLTEFLSNRFGQYYQLCSVKE